ncbi:hypothetical protein [Paenibacillus prosopidis]|uniref:Uncharacterized protein n=1 Tax=Paenibacillus prosopidis TaxID=630520 RepID=A0A368VR82_9BACL|nr:hypothetical protein [Paenibacillus prosopidis]RCW43525.1 hypothetical protein DFP97_113199 [Paenibacillus prosopidis]
MEAKEGITLKVRSGSYTLKYRNEELFRVVYTDNSLVREILAFKEDKELLEKAL